MALQVFSLLSFKPRVFDSRFRKGLEASTAFVVADQAVLPLNPGRVVQHKNYGRREDIDGSMGVHPSGSTTVLYRIS